MTSHTTRHTSHLSTRTVPAAGLLAVLVLLLFALAARPALAAGIVVNSAADDIDPLDGECTLREAIIAANTDTASGGPLGECDSGSGPDAITFDANYTITLGSQLPAVTTEMTITGNGAANTIIQASTCNPVTLPGGCTPASWRVLEVTSAGNLTLDGVTVRHGRCAGACSATISNGGGIYNWGTLAVTNSILSDNGANTLGGGIFSTGDLLTVSSSTLSGNSAGLYAGGIFTISPLTVTNSTLSGNTAADRGGGIYVASTTTVTTSTFSGNSAGSSGGGIYVGNDLLTVSNSTLSGNTAGSGGGLGGGGIFSGGTTTVTNSTLSGNLAPNGNGGGIFVSGGTTTVTNTTLYGNQAALDGASVYVPTGAATLTNSLLTAAVVAGHCDGVTADASNIADDSTCDSATQKTLGQINLDTTLASNGGPTHTHALLAGSHAIDFDTTASCAAAPVDGLDQRGFGRNIDGNGAASANECDAGAFEYGGLPAFCTGFPMSAGTEIELNEAIACYNLLVAPGTYTINLTADIDLTASTVPIDNPIAGIDLLLDGQGFTVDGQGISGVRPFRVNTDSDATFDDISIMGGKVSGNGGGIFNAGTLTVTNSTLSGNSAGDGGGIYNQLSTLTVTDSTLSGNSVTGSGGGLYGDRSTLTVTNSTLSGNSTGSTGYGGGIVNAAGTLTVSNSTLSGNSARFGGGIASVGRITMTVTNSTLSGNSADLGGGIFNGNGGTLTVTNSTLSGNSATEEGGGIYNDGTATLARGLIAGNSAAAGDEIYNFDTITANAFNVFGHRGQTNADAFDGFTPGATDFNATSSDQNVLLTDILNTTLVDNGGPTETHALVPGSPAIDFGSTASCAAAPVNGLDQRGYGRSVDGNGAVSANECDAGAYEYQPPTVTLTIAKETTPAGGQGFPFTVDPAPYAFDFKWGTNGSGNGQFVGPVSVAVDAAGNVYVGDAGNDRMQKFDSSGGYLGQWGSFGSGDGQFILPSGVGVDAAGNVYVTDFFNDRIQKFDSSGAFITKWGTSGSGDGQFNRPYDVAVDAAGNVYVTDSSNDRIQKFDSSGTFITKWGTFGTGNGQFDTPTGVAVDAAGNVYVADAGNDRIQKFDSGGGYLGQWGTSGSGNGQFDNPSGVAVDAAGNVYVADTDNQRIQKFDSSGNYVTQWGGLGTGDGQFSLPYDVAVDAAGNVYVADASNRRIQVFNPGLSTTLDDGQSDSFDLAPGEYLVSELVPNGWTLDNINCDGGSPNYNDVSGVALALAAGEDVTCTFSNAQDAPASFCPVDNEDVGFAMTDLIGTGQGSTTKGYRTRKLVIPNADDLTSLYGQLAAVDVGLMKYVRFLPQGYPKIQIHDPTSMAYRTYAVDWWGSKLPTDINYVKGQFFWGKKGNKAPRAFVLWPTYNTEELYANVFVTFDESSENHVSFEPGFIQTQTQIVEIPETQAAGANVVVRVALVDNNKDGRPVILTVSAPGAAPVVIDDSVPNAKDTLNLYEVTLEGVDAGVTEVTLKLESPYPDEANPQGGDSVAMIGAAVNYACGGVPEETGTITIVKELVFLSPPPNSDWEFTLSGPAGSGDFTIPAAGGTYDGGSLPVGAWTFTETTKQFWDVSVTCNTGESSDTNSIAFTLDAGEDVTCTFQNLFPQ